MPLCSPTQHKKVHKPFIYEEYKRLVHFLASKSNLRNYSLIISKWIFAIPTRHCDMEVGTSLDKVKSYFQNLVLVKNSLSAFYQILPLYLNKNSHMFDSYKVISKSFQFHKKVFLIYTIQ